jgi:hypothetical protein
VYALWSSAAGYALRPTTPSGRVAFDPFAIVYTALAWHAAMLAACHTLVGRALHLRHLRPSRWLTRTLAVLAAAWLAALIVPSTPWSRLGGCWRPCR